MDVMTYSRRSSNQTLRQMPGFQLCALIVAHDFSLKNLRLAQKIDPPPRRFSTKSHLTSPFNNWPHIGKYEINLRIG